MEFAEGERNPRFAWRLAPEGAKEVGAGLGTSPFRTTLPPLLQSGFK